MKCQPNSNYKSDDVVMTPQPLADAIVNHFRPTGDILEPCKGTGAFLNAFRAYSHETCRLSDIDWCEITEGRDFNQHPPDEVDWIITNPPWSQIRSFLQRSMQISDNVVFLMTINHAWTKARIRDVREAGFGIKEIATCDTPKSFPSSGFQLGAVHWQRGWDGPITFSHIEP